jgi:probable rRNA maturation factor
MSRLCVISSSVRSLKVDRARLKALIAALDAHWQAPAGELDITFVWAETIAELHAQFCHDPSQTDIITFPYGGEDGLWGELTISPQAAAEFVKIHGGRFDDELKRYVIHGYLHLMGYNDLTKGDRANMRRLERKSLEVVKSVGVVFSWKR